MGYISVGCWRARVWFHRYQKKTPLGTGTDDFQINWTWWKNHFDYPYTVMFQSFNRTWHASLWAHFVPSEAMTAMTAMLIQTLWPVEQAVTRFLRAKNGAGDDVHQLTMIPTSSTTLGCSRLRTYFLGLFISYYVLFIETTNRNIGFAVMQRNILHSRYFLNYSRKKYIYKHSKR